jgi:hypothetical protein
MIDIVYPISLNCDIDNHWELRMSLRSVEKYFDVCRIFVVGHKPDWLINAVHVDVQDSYLRNPDANIIQKVVAACGRDVSDEFIRMSDDQYLLRPVDYRTMPTVSTNNHNPTSRGAWHRRMKNTLNHLEKRGLSTINYESHCPQKINRLKYIETMMSFSYGEDIGMCGNTLYYNSVSNTSVPSNNLVHISPKTETLDSLLEISKKMTYININCSLNNAHKAFLSMMFPDKSCFER